MEHLLHIRKLSTCITDMKSREINFDFVYDNLNLTMINHLCLPPVMEFVTKVDLHFENNCKFLSLKLVTLEFFITQQCV